ncbi:helicase associated domain-containing protein [Priestia filamentosa]|uniref:helicase associated domain-containing protein n=1 Tax=Priestia filamentosa TaxID=1402861 RepID=UPI0039826FFC
MKQSRTSWEQNYKALADYIEEYKNPSVPKSENYKSLYSWVQYQRKAYRKGTLATHKIRKLNSLGFVWNSFEEKWEYYYQILALYKMKYGDDFRKQIAKENESLNEWIRSQRRAYNKGVLSLERIRLLERVGFMWEATEENWQRKLNELIEYKKKYGDTLVPIEFKKNSALAHWVLAQRYAYEKGELSQKKIKQLQGIGFVWNVFEDSWDRNYNKLIGYIKKEKINEISYKVSGEAVLNRWIDVQRKEYRNKILSRERIDRLEAIGFIWDPLEVKWNKRFQELVSFKNQNGHTLVPFPYPENKSLSLWVRKLRNDYRKGKVSLERIEKLNSIEFAWNIHNWKWGQYYLALKEYVKINGHPLVHWQEDKELSSWVIRQRTAYKEERLSPEKIKMLEDIGFVWSIKS